MFGVEFSVVFLGVALFGVMFFWQCVCLTLCLFGVVLLWRFVSLALCRFRFRIGMLSGFMFLDVVCCGIVWLAVMCFGIVCNMLFSLQFFLPQVH